MNIAVNKVPPKPNKLKGARAERLLREHRGRRTNDVSNRILLDRLLTSKGKLNVYGMDMIDRLIVLLQ
jgi:hypothetical protein